MEYYKMFTIFFGVVFAGCIFSYGALYFRRNGYSQVYKILKEDEARLRSMLRGNKKSDSDSELEIVVDSEDENHIV